MLSQACYWVLGPAYLAGDRGSKVVNQINYQFLTPILLCGFALSFYLIYRQGKIQRAAKFWAIAYLVGAIAFVADLSRPFIDPIWASLGSNGLFIVVPGLLALGFGERYNRKVNKTALIAVGSITFLGLIFFWFGVDSFQGRTATINLGISLMFVLSLQAIDTSSRLTIDRLLFVLIFVIAVQLMMRAPLVLLQTGEVLTQHTYNTSSFAMSLRFFNSVLSISLASLLLGSAASDLVMELKRRTNTDSLTGLRNRRGFKEASQKQLKLHASTSLPVSLIIADVDNFKSINDTLGHQAGDTVLAKVADVLNACSRRMDRVGRWGGEEFCILLPSANLQMASLVAETARAKLESSTFDGLDGQTVTSSFGVAEWKPGESFEALFERADAALFYAKDAGRNCVEAFSALHDVNKSKEPMRLIA